MCDVKILNARFLIDQLLFTTIIISHCEMGFSTLNRVKTTHRANLGNKVLNVVLAVSLRGPEVQAVDFESAVQDWHS